MIRVSGRRNDWPRLVDIGHSYQLRPAGRLTLLSQLAVDNPVFGARQPENASRINGTQSQIACGVDPVPLFDDANQPTSSASCSCDTTDASKTSKSIAIGISWRTSACAGGKVVQRQVLYLGEINDGQFESWHRLIEAFDEDNFRLGKAEHHEVAIIPVRGVRKRRGR
jgi:hypothetical protein